MVSLILALNFILWSQYQFLHLYAIHFLYVYPWKFGVLLGIIFFSFHHLSAWKLHRKRFLYYISNHYPGSEWLIHLITRFLMVAQDVQCNAEESPQTSFVSGQIGPVAFPPNALHEIHWAYSCSRGNGNMIWHCVICSYYYHFIQ